MGSAAHDSRPGRESLSKRLGRIGRQIKARDGHSCRYCGATAESSGSPLQLDHLQPRAHGGADVATNLVLACRRCNRARSTKSLAEWSAFAAAKLGLAFEPSAIWAQAALPLPAEVR